MSDAVYNAARKKAEAAYNRALVRGQYPYISALDDMCDRNDIAAEVDLGVMDVPLSMVVGTRTRGRQNSFACNFMPLLKGSTEFATKWSHLYDYQVNEGINDPIKCYEYMNRLYVEEGNKRVSVMKYLGAYSILANVIRLVPKKNDTRASRLYYEYLDFYKVSELLDFTFTREGSYKRLAALLGQDLTTPWPEELRMNVRSAFNIFSEIYRKKGGDNLRISPYDAFLVYLTVDSLDGILHGSEEAIGAKISRSWNEFLTEENTASITLVDKPEVVPGAEAEPVSPSRSAVKTVVEAITGAGGPRYSAKNPLRVAFIHEKKGQASSWVYAHELGRNEIREAFGGVVETIAFEDCDTPEKVGKAIEAALTDEDDVIFTTSPMMVTTALKYAVDNPRTRFLNCSVNLSVNAVRTYYPRMYEAKFLMGIISAILSDNHKLGYCADYPIYGTIANINAFAIGASMVDPEVKVYLEWASMKNVNWEEALLAKGARIISGPDFIVPDEGTSRRYGVYRVEEDGSLTSLAAPLYQWGTYYKQLIRTILNGTWDDKRLTKRDEALGYWYGMSAGVVDIVQSAKLPYSLSKTLASLRRGIITGAISPFEGEIHSQTDLIQGPEAGPMPYQKIIDMDYLNDNVIGEIPPIQELKPDAEQTVKTVGVKDAVVAPTGNKDTEDPVTE